MMRDGHVTRGAWRRLCVVVWSFALGLLLGCKTPPAPQWKPPGAAFVSPLTLEKCLELAQSNDIRVADWQARLKVARAAIVTAKTLPNPTLNLVWEDIGLKDPVGGASLMSRTMTGTYPIFFWWTRPPKIASAKAGLREEEAAIHTDLRELVTGIATAYYGLVTDQRKVALAKQLVKIADESLRLAQKKLELGLGSGYDVQRAKTEILQAGSDLADAEGQLRLDQLTFAFALGADRPFYPAVVDTNDSPTLPASSISPSGELPPSLIATALELDPQYAKARAAREAAEADLHLQYRLAVPIADIPVVGGARHEPEGYGGVVSFDVPIPLFDRNQGGIQRSQAQLLAAQAAEEKARRAAIASFAQVWERARTAVEKWNTHARPLLQNLERNRRAATTLFAAGQITYTDLLQTQRDLQQAQLKELDVWREAVVAVWTLKFELGHRHAAPSGLQQTF